MVVSEKKLENAKMEMEIEVSPERVEVEYKSVFNKIQQSVKIDGFRKGKAPIQIVEQKYKGAADSEVVENIIRAEFFTALKEKELTPISEPQYEIDGIDRGDTFKFKAVFEIMPTVDLGSYTGIKVEEKACSVNEGDVDKELENLRERHAEVKALEPETAIENGFLVKLKLQRQDKEDQEAKDFSIVVGKSTDPYTVDKQIIGMKSSDEKDVTIKYPKDYHIDELAGDKVTYKVVINSIEEMNLPEVDDEFAKKTGFESVEDLKTKTRGFIDNYVTDKTRGEAKAEILKIVVESSTFDIPESMIVREADEAFKKMQQRFGFFEEDKAKFAEALGMTPETLASNLSDEAARSIQTTLVLDAIAKKEELNVPEEKIKEVIERIAARNNNTVDVVEKYVNENETVKNNLTKELLLDEAMDFIYQKAQVKQLAEVSLEELTKAQ